MTLNRPVLLGQFRPLDSSLHHLDARSKIMPVTIILILALLTKSFVFYSTVMLTLMIGLLVSGVSLRGLLTSLRPILILVLITAFYHLVFGSDEGSVLLSLGSWELTSSAVNNAAFFSLRLILFVCVAFLVTLTNSPSELAEAMARLFAPLARLRVPVAEMAMIVFIAIRFIPILFEEFTTIRHAQIMRGVSFTGSIVSRIKKTTVIVVPVFLAALQRADELALAIQARGYDGRRKRTFYSTTTFGRNEIAFISVTTIGLLALFWVTR
jgi:energy-coupling factor transport system permease protein